MIVELADGRVIAFEVKADAAPAADAGRHLRWLRDSVGERFVVGVVLHTGPRVLRYPDGILAVPICAFWG